MLATIFGHYPAGSSFKQSFHYLQLVESNRFALFNYGKIRNRQLYGQDNPPDYPIEKISTPVALYYAKNDYLAMVKDVQMLCQRLPNVVEDYLFPYRQWNHISVIYELNSRELAHKRMLELLAQYTLVD